MNQVALQTKPTPAQRLAEKIRARTNDTRDILNLLHDIAQGGYDATTNDQIYASRILFDRGYGKCPKQPPVQSQARPELSRRVEGPAGSSQTPDPAPETDNDVEPAPYSIRGAIRESPALRESPPAIPHNEPESPRLVTRLDDSLNDSLGPAPRAQEDAQAPISPNPFDPSSIQYLIQEHVVAITNDADTLIDVLMDIAYADEDDPKAHPEQEPALNLSKPVLSKAEGGRRITAYHRNQASRILVDRGAGTSCAPTMAPALNNAPDTPRSIDDSAQDENVPDPKWLEALAKIQQMKDEGILTPDPNAPEIDHSYYMKGTEEEIRPYAAEVVAKYRADLELRTERRKQWPEIEERRRKKLAEIYPSHSEDGGPPHT